MLVCHEVKAWIHICVRVLGGEGSKPTPGGTLKRICAVTVCVCVCVCVALVLSDEI